MSYREAPAEFLSAMALVAAMSLAGCATPESATETPTVAPPGGHPADAGDLGARIRAHLAPLVESGDLNGVVLVGRGDRVVFEGVWGMADFERGVPLRTDHRFDVASLSKTFTASAVVALVEEGRLELDDRLIDYLPDLAGAASMTIEHLLLHSSGLPEESELPDYLERRDEPLTLEQAVARFTGRQLRFEPGTDGAYSNTGYLVLARVVEIVSGIPFASFLRQRILDPLGMDGTGIDGLDDSLPEKAIGHEPGPSPSRVLEARSPERSHAIGAGAMSSTVRDLHRWLGAIAAESPAAPLGRRYPYGWGRRDYFGHPAIEQSGIVDGYLAEMVLLPDEGLHVVYLTNLQSGVVFGRILRGVSALALGLEPEALTVPWWPPASGVEAPAEIEGTFHLDGPGEVSIVPGAGGLYLEWVRFASRAYLEPLGGDRFFARKDGALLEVRRDSAGRPAALVWNPGPDEAVAPRVELR